MRKYIVLALILAVFTASQVFAETLNLQTLPVTTGGGYYVGAVGGNINGGTTANYYCDDFSTTTYVPSSFSVLISSLSNIGGAKFASQADALKKYQQVGWLMNQMEINPANIAAIQFAMWSVFTPSTPTFADSAAWLAASANINASSYDFSGMRIYTNPNNQEFIGGSVKEGVKEGSTAAPEPAEWMLLIIGLGLITFSAYRNTTKGVVLIRA
ncbi:MAG: hypothetical protein NTY86_08150 [Deltaproteobacteria bacterium]|nr:hypothetical protein [Deltaproteobacteria bacterium]